jgi:hypothetical protein
VDGSLRKVWIALGLYPLRKPGKRTPLLRSYVDAWLASGPDLSRFEADNPLVWSAVERQWRTEPPELRCSFSGGATIWWPDSESGRPERDALQLFVALITNPWWPRLGGPCDRCKRYYVRRTSRNPKRFCSRDCGTRTTAIAATRKARDRQSSEKLKRASRLIQQWTSLGVQEDWKVWISLRDLDITVKWLTRVVNQGRLRPPISAKESIARQLRDSLGGRGGSVCRVG